jgi:DNA-binding MurR/RpiR family transcriptional regulator
VGDPSSVIAIDASYRFSQFGFQAYAYTDVLFMNVMASNMTCDDVAIGISHSGTTKVVVDAMRHAKNTGAVTIAISSFAKSILCNENDYKISVYADEKNYPVEAVSARMAHMCIIDALMMTLATMKFDDFSKYILIRNRILDEIRY